MAQLSRELINLIEVALDAPMEPGDEGVVEMITKEILKGSPEDELAHMKHLKILLLVAQRVNKAKERLRIN